MLSPRAATLQLSRLERLMDVVFALIIWRFFMLLSRPDGDSVEWTTVVDMLALHWDKFILVLLGTTIVIVFWLQNNSLLGRLQRSDGIHTTFSIFQLVFLLLMLYSIGLGIRHEGEVTTKIMGSVAVMLAGLMAYFGWRYAMFNGKLLADDVSEEDAKVTLERNMAEPVTAAVTIPFAFVGPLAWELSWFLYPVIKAWFSRSRAQQE